VANSTAGLLIGGPCIIRTLYPKYCLCFFLCSALFFHYDSCYTFFSWHAHFKKDQLWTSEGLSDRMFGFVVKFSLLQFSVVKFLKKV